VGPIFCTQQEQRDQRQKQLQNVGASFLWRDWLPPPGGGGTTAQTPDLPKNQQIQQRTDEGEEHHRDADCGDVHLVGQLDHTEGRSEGGCSDEQADAAESDECAANTLKEGEEDRGPIEEFQT